MSLFHPWSAKIKSYTARIFHGEELGNSQTLYVVAWVLLFGWFLEFLNWSRYSDFTLNAVLDKQHLCWPFFQSCGDWYFLTQPLLGNTQTIAYALLFALMSLAGVCLVKRRFEYVYFIFSLLFLWEVLVLLMSMRLAVNYWYFHVLYAAVFLFVRQKLLYLRVSVVLIYFFAGILKFDPSWLLGTYFTSLEGGLYLIPRFLIPVATNAVIVLEVVIAWLLLSPQRMYRLVAVCLLFIFHTYSILYVGYLYPAIALPMVLALFLSEEVSITRPVVAREHLRGLCIVALLVLTHMTPLFIEGGGRITGEGNKFGVYMFEANYQCRSNASVSYSDGTTEKKSSASFLSNHRCDPYAHWFYFKQLCMRDPTIRSVSWTYDVSINGDPFLRIVDVPDACALRYRAFFHNSWIRIPGKDVVEEVGLPMPNRYGSPFDPRVEETALPR